MQGEAVMAQVATQAVQQNSRITQFVFGAVAALVVIIGGVLPFTLLAAS
jgi:hypothetical protein